MPRLPTIRVIGSQAISTRPLESSLNFLVVATVLPPRSLVTGHELVPGRSPSRLVLECVVRDLPETSNRASVQPARHRRNLGAGWLVHERHELVGESRHGAADADTADVRATADAVDPTPLRD